MKRSILDLQNKIKNAAQNYYQGKESISDAEFDKLVDELAQKDPDNEYLHKVGWGYNPVNSTREKVKHPYGVVGSLRKIHSADELPMQRNLALSAKLDGGSCVAHFKNGAFVKAVSRGDGNVGIDVSAQWLKIVDKNNIRVPEYFTGTVRGEIVIKNNDWLRYLREVDNAAKSPRNVAVGLLMRDEVSEELQYVSFVTYKIHGFIEQEGFTAQSLPSYTSQLVTLCKFGFDVVPFATVCDDNGISGEELLRVLTECYDMWSQVFPIDGIVVNKGNSFTLQENGLCVFDDVAFKFAAETKTTKVTSVTWNITKSNKFVPVINVEPVELSGAVVNKSTGFNYAFIVDNKVGKGSEVEIMRSGEVIPYITKVLSQSNDSGIPEKCPVCGKPLTQVGVELVCANIACPNIAYSLCKCWVINLGVRDMLGIGPAYLDNFLEYVAQAKHITNVTVDAIMTLNISEKNFVLHRFTPAVREKIETILHNLYEVPVTFDKFVKACNLPGIGDITSRKISNILQTALAQDYETEVSKVLTINGLGECVYRVLLENKELLQHLSAYCKFEDTEVEQQKGILVAVTGTLSMPRKMFEVMLKQRGYTLSDNIAQCKYLITNDPDSGSSKLKKAKKYNIPIISESDFVSKLPQIV